MKKYPSRRADWYDPATEIPRPIFGIDIDGTLGPYHEHFWKFAEAWLGRPLPHPSQYRGGSYAAFLGLSKSTYRRIKLAFRRGGLKRSMPVYPGARDLTRGLRKRGAVVLLCTTRPYLSLENIDEDTRHWARRNEIQNDGILWGEHKYRDLARGRRGRVVSVLEDIPELARQATESGLLVNIKDQPYNAWNNGEGYTCPGYRVTTLFDAAIAMHEQLDEWEAVNR